MSLRPSNRQSEICAALRDEATRIRIDIRAASDRRGHTTDPVALQSIQDFIQTLSDRLVTISEEMLLNNCTRFPPPPSQSSSPAITGIEIIQSVQTPDNAVPLIGQKPTYVMAYIRSPTETMITGRLIARDPVGVPRTILPLAPIMALPEGSTRGVWSTSLNFRLDDDLTLAGEREITVIITDQALARDYDSARKDLRFRHRIDLHVYGVVWAVKNNDDGQGAPIGPAAPWSDLEGHRRYVENVYPVTSFTIHPVPGVGMQPPDPQTFGNLIQSRTWATNKLAQLPKGSIINLLDNWDSGGLHGFAWGSACEEQNARDNRIGHVMAQEVAHTLGLWWHTFTPGTPYPRPDGTIGPDEICLNLTAGSTPQLYVGSTPTYDIMSYQYPRPTNWASAFTYNQLLDVITQHPPPPPPLTAPGVVGETLA